MTRARLAEWQLLDGIKRDLEAPIEAECLTLFDEQRQEVLRLLDQFRSASTRERAMLFSLDRIFDFALWIAETAARLSGWFRDTIIGGYGTASAQLDDLDIELADLTSSDPAVRSILDEMVANSRSITETTRDMLSNIIRQALVEGWSVDRTSDEIQRAFEDMAPHRAHTIAVTNVTAGFSAGQLVAFRRAGVDKQWLSQRDRRARETHIAADGQRRQVDEPFQVGLAQPQHPADPAIAGTNPEEFFGCRCAMLPVKRPKITS